MNPDVMKSLATALVRYALIAIGAFLVRKGIVDQDLINTAVPQLTITLVGAIILAIPVIWKYIRAKFLHQLVQTALNAPAGTPVEVAVAKTKEIIANQ
jgi:hypothetical protein